MNRHDQIYALLAVVLTCCLQLFGLLGLLFPPSADVLLPLRDRLFYNFHGEQFHGRDVFALFSRQCYLFWLNTGETPESFLEIVRQTAPRFFALTRRGNVRQRLGRFKLSIVNRVLVVFMWLRTYPHLHTLSLLFDVSPQTIKALLYQGIGVLWHHFNSSVTWPTNQEWNGMRNTWIKFPHAVGCIDVTPHEILKPSIEPQRQFYSGHRHYHLLNAQMICDNHGRIRFLQAGFLGSTHDSQSFRLMEPVGPGQTLDLPQGVALLGDQGYPDNPPLLTPFRPVQLRRMNNQQRRRARRFNRELSRRRIKIEHIFKNLKDFRCISGIWRHPRWLLPCVVELCTFLTERRLRLFENV